MTDASERYSLIDAQRARRQRQSSPDSDPAELKKKLRARDEADDAERDRRLDKLEDAVTRIDKSFDSFAAEMRAMFRAYAGALGVLLTLIGLGVTLVVKFWK